MRVLHRLLRASAAITGLLSGSEGGSNGERERFTAAVTWKTGLDVMIAPLRRSAHCYRRS